MSVSLATLGTASMLAFWLAWMIPFHFVIVANCTLGIVLGAALALRAVSIGLWRDEIVPPLCVAFAASVILLLWVHVGSDLSHPLHVAAQRWTHPLPGDNEIPLIFARGIRAGQVPSPLVGDWLSSDRPPLQTAIFLLTPNGFSERSYQTAAVAIQMTALLGAWALVRALTESNRLALATMVGVFFTPFTLVNGAFVWPKLLAASFLLALAALYFSPAYKTIKENLASGVLCGALAALSMLSHGGSAFVLLGMAIAAIALRRLATRRFVLGALAAFVVLYGPWIAYQQFVDPPGDRLLKWHLAGVVPVDERPLSKTIREAYQAQPLSETIAARAANIEIVFSGSAEFVEDTAQAAKLVASGRVEEASALLKDLRKSEFFLVIAGSGVLGLSLWALWLGFFNSVTRPLTTAFLASLIVWIGLLFKPANAVIHQGSLFLEVALIVIAIVFAWRRSHALAFTLVGVQSFVTIFQYAM